jgi:magnesium-transporting ATPase (P-type)
MAFFSRYSKWITLLAVLTMVLACFLPWAYYPDLQRSFNGFYSENNIYGKPAKLMITFSLISLLAQFLSFIFLKRLNLLLMALNLAYAIKSFIVFGACYRGICPQKQVGLYLVILASVVLMITATLPSGDLKKSTTPEAV